MPNAMTDRLGIVQEIKAKGFGFGPFRRTITEADGFSLEVFRGDTHLGSVQSSNLLMADNVEKSYKRIGVKDGDVILRISLGSTLFKIKQTLKTRDGYFPTYELEMEVYVTDPRLFALRYRQGNDPMHLAEVAIDGEIQRYARMRSHDQLREEDLHYRSLHTLNVGSNKLIGLDVLQTHQALVFMDPRRAREIEIENNVRLQQKEERAKADLKIFEHQITSEVRKAEVQSEAEIHHLQDQIARTREEETTSFAQLQATRANEHRQREEARQNEFTRIESKKQAEFLRIEEVAQNEHRRIEQVKDKDAERIEAAKQNEFLRIEGKKQAEFVRIEEVAQNQHQLIEEGKRKDTERIEGKKQAAFVRIEEVEQNEHLRLEANKQKEYERQEDKLQSDYLRAEEVVQSEHMRIEEARKQRHTIEMEKQSKEHERLERLLESVGDEAMNAISHQIREKILAGYTLSQALNDFPELRDVFRSSALQESRNSTIVTSEEILEGQIQTKSDDGARQIPREKTSQDTEK